MRRKHLWVEKRLELGQGLELETLAMRFLPLPSLRDFTLKLGLCLSLSLQNGKPLPFSLLSLAFGLVLLPLLKSLNSGTLRLGLFTQLSSRLLRLLLLLSFLILDLIRVQLI